MTSFHSFNQNSPYGKDITWFHQGVVAWKGGKEKQFNHLKRVSQSPGLDTKACLTLLTLYVASLLDQRTRSLGP